MRVEEEEVSLIVNKCKRFQEVRFVMALEVKV